MRLNEMMPWPYYLEEPWPPKNRQNTGIRAILTVLACLTSTTGMGESPARLKGED
jgi:hypothetical protein